MPETGTGMLLLVFVPFPSCPLLLNPQQTMPPLASTAQLWLLPAATLRAVVTPETGTGAPLFVVLPLPSCPLPFSPQQSTPPLASTAQVWLPPAETCR